MKLRTGYEGRKALKHRSLCNYYTNLVCYLYFCGVDHKKLLPQSERPWVDDGTPECYNEKKLQQFFFQCVDERDNLAFTFLWRTGTRESEMTRLKWEDLDLGLTPVVNFPKTITKTRKARTVPWRQTWRPG